MVKQLERPVKDRKIKNNNAAHTKADSGMVYRRMGEDAEYLPDAGENHGAENNRIALCINTGHSGNHCNKNKLNRKEDAVVYNSMKRLSDMGNYSVIDNIVCNIGFYAESMAKKGFSNN